MGDCEYIHDDIKLYITSDKFYLEPTIDPKEIMVIDRITAEAKVEDIEKVKIPIPSSAYKPVCGFLGSIKLIAGNYLVVAKYRTLMGVLGYQEVYQLAGVDFIPYSRSTTHLNSKQIEDNNTYLQMLQYAFDTPGIYFSYRLDITHTLQRLHAVNMADFQKMSIASRVDPRFMWNGYLLKDYLEPQFGRFALPIMQGFVSITQLTVGGQSLTWSIISRRSVERAGTRFYMRGVDAQGQVANYVETEQIIEKGVTRVSFVQTRGSIPLFWTQYPNLKYKPSPELAPEDHVAAYTKHMRDQIQRYGGQVLLNLIDQCGKEEALERGYRAAVAAAALPSVRYEAFDFHSECRGMRYDRLNILMDRVAHEQKEFGFFVVRGGNVVRSQAGVFRTNCIDCLDRTNVVQSMLAARQLAAALQLLDVSRGDALPPAVQPAFNNVWADHADAISTQYSGTGALKTDFTRTGKRTHMGLLNDGLNSLTRYYKNNLSDGWRQDSIDLVLGKYRVSEAEDNTAPCPLRTSRDWKYYALPSMLLVSLSVFCYSAAPAGDGYSARALLLLLTCGAALVATAALIFKNGTEFVDWPRLASRGARPSPQGL